MEVETFVCLGCDTNRLPKPLQLCRPCLERHYAARVGMPQGHVAGPGRPPGKKTSGVKRGVRCHRRSVR
jgi:hypothetical protein